MEAVFYRMSFTKPKRPARRELRHHTVQQRLTSLKPATSTADMAAQLHSHTASCGAAADSTYSPVFDDSGDLERVELVRVQLTAGLV